MCRAGPAGRFTWPATGALGRYQCRTGPIKRSRADASLDSAAQSAGLLPPLVFTVAAAVKGMTTQAPAAMLQGKVSGVALGFGKCQRPDWG